MFRTILTSLMAVFGLVVLSSGALASDAYGNDRDGIKVWKPYVIEKYCNRDYYECKVRMDYAPFQRSMVARPGSYWYQKPFRVYRYGDFRHRRARFYHHHHHHTTRHQAWCSAHYRTYDRATDTFVGKGYKRYRCISP